MRIPAFIRAAGNHSIYEGIVKALFASAWADQATECEVSLTGDIMDQMPVDPDPAALSAAQTLYMDVERFNGLSVAHLFNEFPGEFNDDPEKWGHYLAMQAIGHGTGLKDHGVPEGSFIVPSLEWGSYSLERDYWMVAEAREPDANEYANSIRAEWTNERGTRKASEFWFPSNAKLFINGVPVDALGFIGASDGPRVEGTQMESSGGRAASSSS